MDIVKKRACRLLYVGDGFDRFGQEESEARGGITRLGDAEIEKVRDVAKETNDLALSLIADKLDFVEKYVREDCYELVSESSMDLCCDNSFWVKARTPLDIFRSYKTIAIKVANDDWDGFEENGFNSSEHMKEHYTKIVDGWIDKSYEEARNDFLYRVGHRLGLFQDYFGEHSAISSQLTPNDFLSAFVSITRKLAYAFKGMGRNDSFYNFTPVITRYDINEFKREEGE